MKIKIDNDVLTIVPIPCKHDNWKGTWFKFSFGCHLGEAHWSTVLSYLPPKFIPEFTKRSKAYKQAVH